MKAQMLKTRFYYTLLNTKIILPFGTFLTNNCFIKKVTSCPSFRSKIHCTIQTFEHKRTPPFCMAYTASTFRFSGQCVKEGQIAKKIKEIGFCIDFLENDKLNLLTESYRRAKAIVLDC